MTSSNHGLAAWITITGIVLLFSVGAILGRMVSRPSPPPSPAEITPTAGPTAPATTGHVSGYLIYPSEFIPEEMGVCAQDTSSPLLITCVKQSKNTKFKTGVGYDMDLAPGTYYIYSSLGDQKAFYTEFVTCGLQASCKSHTKIPVVVTAGSVQDNILPHDWYDTSPTPTPTKQPLIEPPVTTAPTIKIPTLKIINPNFRILPTATPTLKLLIKPTIKFQLP